MLPQVAAGTASPTQALSVTKRVFASPVVVAVNMDKPQARSAESETVSCYPDVCFAVENFDDAFTDLVRRAALPGACFGVTAGWAWR